jgi:purine-binding chemotaxis protein CheW
MAVTKQLCTFRLGDQAFGVDALTVQELIRHQTMTRVPKAPESVRGLINLRGQIVTALDLRTRLGMEPLEEGRQPMNVVIRSDDGAVSLLVDQIGDVIEVNDDCFEVPPDTLSGKAREFIRGAYKLADRLLLLLDCELAVQVNGDATKSS